MNLADRVREVIARENRPFMGSDIYGRIDGVDWREINATLHRLANRGELEKTLIENPKGHGMATQFIKTALLRVPGMQRYGVRGASSGQPRDIGNPEAALRLQHALNQMAWRQQCA